MVRGTLTKRVASLAAASLAPAPQTSAAAAFQHAPLLMFSEQENAYRDNVARFAKEVVAPRTMAMDAAATFDPELRREMFEHGFFGIEVPAEYGGSESSFTNVAITIEELAKQDPNVGLIVDLHNSLVNSVFMWYGNEEQKARYLPRLTTDTIGCFCLTEEGTGSDAFALQTTATKSDDGSYYTLNGKKTWISNVGYAGVFVVFANADPSKGHKGITCFLVDRETEGLELSEPFDKLGIRATSVCSVTLNNVKVKKENILGNVGEGYKIAICNLNEARMGLAAKMVGIAQGAFNLTVPYLYERKQFGQFVGDFQAMQHQQAEAAINIEAARLLLYNATRMKDAGLPFVKQASMAKVHASRIAEKTASQCIEWLGAIGFSKTVLAEKYYRDAKVAALLGGTTNIQLTTIAKIIKNEVLQGKH